MESTRLGVRPGVEGPNDLAAAVGVGAAVLDAAGVADVGTCAIADEAALVVELVRPEVLPLGAEPVVERRVIAEARRSEAERPPVCVRREPLERERTRDEEGGVAGGDDDFGAQVSLAAAASASLIAASPPGSRTSVNRMSSGSSSVTCLTVCRMPR